MVDTQALYSLFLLLLGAERLFELDLSRVNLAHALRAGAIEHGRGHFRVMAVVHLMFLLACGLEVWGLDRPFVTWVAFPALGVVLSAQFLRYWAVLSLGRCWNVRIVVWPEQPLVTRGPYRFVRHPNYVAVAVEILAIPLVHNAWITAIAFSLVNAAVLAIRIREEETALGARYRHIFADRPRFLPQLGRERAHESS